MITIQDVKNVAIGLKKELSDEQCKKICDEYNILAEGDTILRGYLQDTIDNWYIVVEDIIYKTIG